MAKLKEPRFSLGVDFGTNSVRALVVDAADGGEVASAVFNYPSGQDGILLDPKDPNLARQNPADYIEGFRRAVAGAVRAAKRVDGFDAGRVVGIGIDTTGSTPLPVDRSGLPLALKARFATNPAAQAWLWKDHTSHAEAAEMTDLARRRGEPYLAKCGGTYSSEWFWSKILHCKRTTPKVFDAAFAWVEQSDFLPAYVTGNLNPAAMPRNICAAGHKAMYGHWWGGLPSREFLDALEPGLARVRESYAAEAVPADRKAGTLAPDLARTTGLPEGIPVAAGILDAHAGAVGAGIAPGRLVKIIGTSACDMIVAPLGGLSQFSRHGERSTQSATGSAAKMGLSPSGMHGANLADIPGVCGMVPGAIVPGMWGLEAGQSAVGDIFNWFVSHMAPRRYTAKGDPHANLTAEAQLLKPGESGLLALDWNNGNRNVLIDPLLTGLLAGQTLHTTAAEAYRAWIEATAFGALSIINRLEEYGVAVREVVACGGIAEKNPFLMQLYADILNRPMKLTRSRQTCALGAAVFGAVVGGAYRTVEQAQRAMTGVGKTVYRPRKAATAVYAELYELYCILHDAFGTPQPPGAMHHVMKRLIAIRDRARR
ncbi:MAG: ribulokinase [Thermoguttaceae bacterium]|jgi:L-ribulokinase|nr:ribulokinase [Thermoguttaceae bacterium]